MEPNKGAHSDFDSIPAHIENSTKKLPTRVLTNRFAIAGFALLFLGLLLKKSQIQNIPNLFDIVILSLVFFIWGCVGIVSLFRKEFYIFAIMLRGIPAQIAGCLFAILGWAIAMLFLVGGIQRLCH